MATVWDRAAHSAKHIFSLLISLFYSYGCWFSGQEFGSDAYTFDIAFSFHVESPCIFPKSVHHAAPKIV